VSPQWSVERAAVEVGAHTRSFTLVRPPVAGGALLIVFHGSTQSGDGIREFAGGAFDAFAADGMVIAYPDGHRGHFNDARLSIEFPSRLDGVDDVAFTEAVIDHVGASAVYVVGYSNGGAMVIRLVHEIGARLTGATTIAATQPAPENLVPMSAQPVPVPVLLFHGTRDRLVPYEGGVNSLWGRTPRGLGLSAKETAAYFAARNGITAEPRTTLVESVGVDRMGVERLDHREHGHPPVTLFTVHGGGHTIPGPTKAPFIFGRTISRLSVVEEMRGFFRSG
jgi:polyhydroxybutyrate depolymerase